MTARRSTKRPAALASIGGKDGQFRAYIANVGHVPRNFQPGTEAYKQWTWTPSQAKPRAN